MITTMLSRLVVMVTVVHVVRGLTVGVVVVLGSIESGNCYRCFIPIVLS